MDDAVAVRERERTANLDAHVDGALRVHRFTERHRRVDRTTIHEPITR